MRRLAIGCLDALQACIFCELHCNRRST